MKSTKKSLLLSTLSLIMCVAMLLGTTYAWFTDSVTSGKNKIQAGNLDVELEYSTDMSAWNTVGEDTDLFEDCLWEPGYTQVVYLKVKNVGTLALQYKLGINIFKETKGKNVAGDEFKLSDYIKFGTKADVTAAYETRDAAREDVSTNAKVLSEPYTASGYMAKGAADKVIALVVYMPEEVDNVANYRATKPEIELGIELLATQWTKEADSFDDQYDKDAEYPEGTEPVVPVEPVEYDDVNHIATINSADGYVAYMNGQKAWYDVELGGDIDFAGTTVATLNLGSKFDGKGYSIQNATVAGGFFAEYNESLSVKNVTFKNITVTAIDADGAGVVASRSRNGVIENIEIIDCNVTGNNYAGAAVGTFECATAKNVTASGCTVKAAKNVGGLFGFASAEGGNVVIQNCSVTGGTVENTKTDRLSVGTVVGRGANSDGTWTATDISASGVTVKNANTSDTEIRLVGDTANTYTISVNGSNFIK